MFVKTHIAGNHVQRDHSIMCVGQTVTNTFRDDHVTVTISGRESCLIYSKLIRHNLN